MSDYGVTPQGFNPKPLADTLAEIETLMVTEFGPGVVQSPQSPLGQLNGLFANLATTLWETAQGVYQSYDPDQAEGVSLDRLGRLRLIERAGNESDADYRLAVTNAGRARNDVQDLARAILNVPGITYLRIALNESVEIDENGIPPGGISVAVLGGDEDEIAAQMRSFVVPGITPVGNTYVSTVIDGYCRTFAILRPILIPVEIAVTVRTRPDAFGCPPVSLEAIREGLQLALAAGDRRLLNGDDVDEYRVRSIIESTYPNVEVTAAAAARIEDISTAQQELIDGGVAAIGFIELATVALDDISVVSA